MSKTIFKKTRNVYLSHHKTFFKHNELFNRFYKYAVTPKNYCLEKKFFKNANVLDAGCGNNGYFGGYIGCQADKSIEAITSGFISSLPAVTVLVEYVHSFFPSVIV